MRAGLKTVKDLMSANKQVAENTEDALLLGGATLGLLGTAAGAESNRYEIKKGLNKFKDSFLTLSGATLGGIGGHGLISLMTKDELLRALGMLGGGVAGGIIGSKLASVNKKHSSENKIAKMNNKFAKNPAPFTLDDKFYSLYDSLRSIINDNYDKNIDYNDKNYYLLRDRISNLSDAFTDEKWENWNRHDELKNRLNRVSTLLGAGVGGLGGYGLTSLMTKNKWLRALGGLAGGAAGGLLYSEKNSLNQAISNLVNKFKK